MIRWPIASARAIARLFRALQNIEVYVEDQGDEAFYTLLFKKAAPPGLAIARVVGLGGRGKVLDAASAYSGTMRAVFLIDGDLPWVRGEGQVEIARVYRLDCYCIENILIQQEPLHQLCGEELMCDADEARGHLDFPSWLQTISPLIGLFESFAILNHFDPARETVGGGVGRVLVAAPAGLPTISQEKVVLWRDEIEAQISADFDPVAVQELRARIQAHRNGLADPFRTVSGKDFLLPLLWFHTKWISRSKVAKDVFRYRLAAKCTQEDLGDIRLALDKAA